MKVTKQYRKKKAIARNYAKRDGQPSMIMGSGAYVKGRPIVRRRAKAPLYRNIASSAVKPMITGGGRYNFSSAGADLGKALGYGLDYILGRGDYTVRANSIMGGVYDPPELHNRSDRTVCVRHREYITDISASSSFALQSYSIQPGLVSSLPWLSQMAQAFEEYRFTGIVFEYKTLSADYTTASSAALGYVIMATQYNVLNANFPDKITMENYEFANSGKPSVSFLHPVECKRSLNPVSELFVRTGAVTSGDLRLYDHGNFQIATGGNSGSGIIGELWCTYEIEFYKPKLVAALGFNIPTDHFSSVTSIASTTPFGTATTPVSGSNAGTSILTGNTLVFPTNDQDGIYMIIYSCSGGAGTVTGPATTFTNCKSLNLWKNDVAGVVTNSGTTSSIYIECFVVQITALDASFAWGTASYPSSPTSMDLWVTKINGGIAS